MGAAMTEWNIVLWSAALQIAQEADLPRDVWPDEDVAPQAYFRKLREGENNMAALSYAACALPKLESIEWALACLPPVEEGDRDYSAKMLLRDASRRWIDEPDDQNRRAVFELAENSNNEWPETLIGLAIFFSGGSITPEDNEPVTIGQEITTKLIGGAMISAVASLAIADPGFADRALDLADRFAVRGREALTTT